jgi:hypothetical protein
MRQWLVPGDRIDRYVVISTDTHAGADLYDYKPYLPTRLHDDFDAWAKTYESPFDDLIVATAKRNWDNELRTSEMDDRRMDRTGRTWRRRRHRTAGAVHGGSRRFGTQAGYSERRASAVAAQCADDLTRFAYGRR